MRESFWKDAHTSRSLMEIYEAYRQLEQLEQTGSTAELRRYLREIKRKYVLEAAIHQWMEPRLPETPQENARQCKIFLKWLYRAALAA